jgi:hypothetical protein
LSIAQRSGKFRERHNVCFQTVEFIEILSIKKAQAIKLAHFSPPHGKSAIATCEEVGGGEALNGGLAWLIFTTNIVF